MKPLISQDYIDVKIDTEKMLHGAEVAARLRKGRAGGIPWIVILDTNGKELINSDAPTGNIGCPVTPEEIKWFMTMIEKTARNLDSKEQGMLRSELEKHAHWIKNRNRKQ